MWLKINNLERAGMDYSKFLIGLGMIAWSFAGIDASSNAKIVNSSPFEISAEVYNSSKQLLLEVKSLTYTAKSNRFEFSENDLPLTVYLGIESGPFSKKQQELEISHSTFQERREAGPKGEMGFDLNKPIVIKLNWDSSKQKYNVTFYNEEPEPTSAMPTWKVTPAQAALKLKELREKRQKQPAESKEPVRELSPAEKEEFEKRKALKEEVRKARVIIVEPRSGVQLESSPAPIAPGRPKTPAPAPIIKPERPAPHVPNIPARPVIAAPKWTPPGASAP